MSDTAAPPSRPIDHWPDPSGQEPGAILPARNLLAMLDRVGDAVAVARVDPPPCDGISMLYANPAFLTRTGMDWAELRALAAAGAAVPEAWAALGTQIRQALIRREPFRLQAALRSPGRPDREVEVEGWPLETDQSGATLFAVLSRDVTVQASEARLRNAIESLSEGFCLVDPGGRLVMTNRRFFEMYPELEPIARPGALAADILKAALDMQLFPEAVGREAEWAAERAARIGDNATPYEFQLRDGRWFLLRETMTPDGWIVSIRSEITREKENERRRTASEQRFRTLAESAPSGVFQTDRDGALLYANPKLCAMAGRRFEAMLGHGWRKAVHPDDMPLVVRNMEALLHGLESADYEIRVADRWVNVLARPDRDADGAIVGVLGMALDTHDRRSIEAALRMSEQRYRKILETAQEGVILNDRTGTIRYANRRLAEIAGRTVEEMIGRSMFDFLDPDARKVIAERFATRATGIPEQYEFRLVRPDGDSRWMLVSSTPMLDEQGAFDGALAMFVDITQRHEAEDKMAAYVAELEESRRQLQELAARYEQEKLRAEESSRAKTRFLSAVTHELRTPLNSILGFSDILRSPDTGPSDLSLRSYADDIHQAGSYLLELINDILDMSKIEAGKYELRIAPVATYRAIEEAVRMLRRHAADQRLELQVSLAPDLPERIRVDGRAVRQVLLNLLSNAIKFTPRGGTVGLKARTAGSAIELIVTDTGIGIPAEDLPRLGLPFEQLDNALSRRHQGTGLGLALSRSLVEMHGGTLTIASEPGRGTTVTVTLPLEAGR